MKKFVALSWILLSAVLWAQSLPAVGDMHPAMGQYAPVEEETWAHASYRPGAWYEGRDAAFALYSKNAAKVLLEIYAGPFGEDARYDYWMQKGPDNVWRAKVAGVGDVVYYGFRLWGPNWTYDAGWARGNSALGFVADFDGNANRFNPNKVVFDPYGREVSHDKSNPKILGTHNSGMFGSGNGDYKGVVRRNFDTGKWSPKSILFRNSGGSIGSKPCLDQKDAIIYEAHVRGITRHPSASRLKGILSGIEGMGEVVDVPDAYRGTYKGAGYLAHYLKALGFNTIELLPVHETDNDGNPEDSPGGNYWGYATFSFFAPDRRYSYDKSPGGPTREFKEMVRAFHDAGIEVYLDVVYNHTGEGGIWDATGKTADIVCFRGIDNAEYYAIPTGAPHAYWETTGCGNNFDCSRAVVKDLVLASLEYWIAELGVDGFRFDLAVVMGRDRSPNYNFNAGAQLLKDIAYLQSKTGAEMIAEAWDISGYEVGNFPYGWGEWNGKYRDAVRRFVKGGAVQTGFADYFNGSYHLYADQGGPQKSVNFVTAHDGFTLMDLVSYNLKNNRVSWPFGPSDGGCDGNDSWDHGGNMVLRRQQLKNLWTIQIFARGVPMSVWGDEFGRTQNGNNNPYNVDSVATWNNYDMVRSDSPNQVTTGDKGYYHDNFGKDAKPDGKNAVFLFVKDLLRVRQTHHALRQDNYNVPYHFAKADGGTLQGHDRAMRIHIDGSAVGDADFLILVNTWTDKIDFTVFEADAGKRWTRLIDTAAWAEIHNNIWPNDTTAISGVYSVQPWSIAVLQTR